MRFEHEFVTDADGTTAWVWDSETQQIVRDGSGEAALFDSVGEAMKVASIMNQRVERPDLTRADGKLVSA